MTTFSKILVEDGSVTIDYRIDNEWPNRKIMISVNGDKVNVHFSCIGNKQVVVGTQYANGVNLEIVEPK